MLPEAIYDQYLLYAAESNRILESYKTLVSQLESEYLKLELIYLHKNIQFIFKKLATVLTNQKLWGNVADNHLQVVYEPSAGLSVACELQFLETYKQQIIQQLRCIHNTTVFETDVLFLSKCFHMLQTSYQKVEERYEYVISSSYRYRIAS